MTRADLFIWQLYLTIAFSFATGLLSFIAAALLVYAGASCSLFDSPWLGGAIFGFLYAVANFFVYRKVQKQGLAAAAISIGFALIAIPGILLAVVIGSAFPALSCINS